MTFFFFLKDKPDKQKKQTPKQPDLSREGFAERKVINPLEGDSKKSKERLAKSEVNKKAARKKGKKSAPALKGFEGEA